MSDARLTRFLLRTAAAFAAAGLFHVALRYLLPWLLPFLIALAAAAAMEPAVCYLQRRLHFRRGFSSLVLTLFLLFLLGGLLSLLGNALSGEAYALLLRAPALLDVIPETLADLSERIMRYCAACPPWLREQLADNLNRFASDAGGLLGRLIGRVPALLATAAAAVPRILLGTATCVLAIYFTSSAMPMLCMLARTHLPSNVLQGMQCLRRGVVNSAEHWMRAELMLSAVTFAELLLGLWFLHQPYALLLSVLITLIDALPVFGAGTVLVPWAASALLFQNIPKAILLLALYLVTLSVRSVLEPRLLGAQAGLPPIASLLAMYLGFQSYGVLGMMLFPFLLLLSAQLSRADSKKEFEPKKQQAPS